VRIERSHLLRLALLREAAAGEAEQAERLHVGNAVMWALGYLINSPVEIRLSCPADTEPTSKMFTK
jgi:hypothetical protein